MGIHESIDMTTRDKVSKMLIAHDIRGKYDPSKNLLILSNIKYNSTPPVEGPKGYGTLIAILRYYGCIEAPK